MKIFAGYGRVSTREQAEKGTSLEDQDRRIKQDCENKGEHYFGFISDDGFSGKSTKNREGIRTLTELAREKKITGVKFTKLDRLGRNLRDLLNVWELFQQELGLELVCLDDPSVSTAGRLGKMNLHMLGAFAEFERDIIKERTDSGRKIKWKEGKARIGQPTYGYRWDDEKKTYEISQRQAKVYNRIVALYLDQNYPFKDIALRLSSNGVQPPSESKGYEKGARRWNPVTISKILKNPAYKGEVYHNRRFYESSVSKMTGHEYMYAGLKEKPEDQWIRVSFPRLISDERWGEIQKRIEFNKRKSKRVYEGYEDHFLAESILVCGECGGKINKRIKWEKGRKPKFYYSCYWHRTSAKDLALNGRERCMLRAVDADDLDARVYGMVVNVVTKPEDFAKDWLRALDEEEVRERLEALKVAEKDQRAKLDRAYQLITNERDPVQRQSYIQMKEKDQEALNDIVSSLKRAEQDFSLVKNKLNAWDNFIKALRKADKRGRMESLGETQQIFSEVLFGLPFQEKKRVLEAVVAPESGGRCVIRFPTSIDIERSDQQDNAESSKKELYCFTQPPYFGFLTNSDKPLSKEERGEPHTQYEPMFELTHQVDIQRLQNVVLIEFCINNGNISSTRI